MNNFYQFNNVIFKGNINRKFYLFCLRKNFKLVKYLFYNAFYFIVSLLILSKKDIYQTRKFRYLKEVKNKEKLLEEFYCKNIINDYISYNDCIIVDRVPKLFIKKIKYKKIIGYDLDDNYDVDVADYNKEVDLITKCNNLYIRNRYELLNVIAKRIILVRNNKFKYLHKRKKISNKLINVLLFLLLATLLTCISFFYANYVIEINSVWQYYEIRLFILNFLPIVLFMLLIYVISKRIYVSFGITSFLVTILGIANQTKLLYRDDVVTFEDILILKEAMIMSKRYSAFIKWYTILFLIFTIVLCILIRRYTKKFKIHYKKRIVSIIVIISSLILGFKGLYGSSKVYSSVGDTSRINIWLGTRQSQIRGLVYPFIYSINNINMSKPEGYSKERAKEVLSKYEYSNIDDDKKVNIIAVMLEAYNDFSKFNVFDFNEDIYSELHNIEDNSISGNLVTTIFGGGTIVTERNFLTGYYSFPSYRKTTNSYVWYFKEQGYNTEAMHPIYRSFYNRASVDPNLGFDIYYNYENKFSKIQEKFMDDDMFFDYIIEGYEKSKNNGKPYFNFSVTYQNHGPYLSEVYEGKEFFIDNKNYDEEAYNTINQYFSGIKKTNLALKKLVDYFDNEEEATIIIFFGDHNPYLGENEKSYESFGINLDLSTISGFENYYETPYVIHANNSAKKLFNNDFVGEGRKISPIFLMNEVFNYCNFKGNQYMQYMSYLEENIDVISEYYYKQDDEFVEKSELRNKELLDEYRIVNYYYSNNYERGGISD